MHATSCQLGAAVPIYGSCLCNRAGPAAGDFSHAGLASCCIALGSTGRRGVENNPYNPKKALAALLSDDAKKLFNDAKDAMTDAEKRLSKREWKGDDTSYARAALYELDYWVSCTADVDAVKDAGARLQRAIECPDPPSALTQDANGSFGPGTNVWFLKLDRSTDQILAREWPWPRNRCFSNVSTTPSGW